VSLNINQDAQRLHVYVNATNLTGVPLATKMTVWPPNQALIEAICAKNVDGIKAAIADGADVNCRTVNGQILDRVAACGDAQIAQIPLAAGANVHARNDAVLRLAAANDHVEVVRPLLAAGANPNVRQSDGCYALDLAADYGNTEIVGILLASGADIHAGQNAALYWAARKNHIGIVRRLLSAGADSVAVWQKTDQEHRTDVVAALDARGDALAMKQRIELVAASRPDEFVKLRAIIKSPQKSQSPHR